MKKKLTNKKIKVFLSHSGKDKAFAFEISKRINHILKLYNNFYIHFFNTSETQYRFKEFEKTINLGMNFKDENAKWENELRCYLERNLVSSDIYLLLVTKRSLIANSEWIKFEMITAESETKKRGKSFFFPCLYDGALFRDLPDIAHMFQATDLNSESGFNKLTEAIKLNYYGAKTK